MFLLAADLVPFIADADVSMVVVRTLLCAAGPQQVTNTEEGVVSYEIVKVLYSQDLKKGDVLDVPYTRETKPLARFKTRFNQWNNLTLESGEMLILAYKALDPPRLWEGLAAQPIGAEDSPEVEEVRRAYGIERPPSPEEKQARLAQALVAGGDLDRRFALDAICDRGAVPRDEGATMLATAIASDKTSPEVRLELAGKLIDPCFFKERKGVDEVNQKVVSTLAQGLAGESDPERQNEWTTLLASPLLSEFSEKPDKDKTVRAALIRGVGPDLSQRVSGILPHQARAGSDIREIAEDLLTAWRAASVRPSP
jgi:hypothetical protein